MKVHEIDDNFFAAAPSALHLSKGAIPSTVNENRFDHLDKGDGKDLNLMFWAYFSAATKAAPAATTPEANVEVDEDLFGDDDLDDIDAELGDMALEDAGMASWPNQEWIWVWPLG